MNRRLLCQFASVALLSLIGCDAKSEKQPARTKASASEEKPSTKSEAKPKVDDKEASLVLKNGKVVTVDDSKPEAQAIAMKGDRIVAVGTNEEIEALVGKGTKVIDLEGKLAIPGFIEGHGHFMSIGQAKIQLDLKTVKNWDEVVAMVKEAAAKQPKGTWILGRGWHQEKWDKVPSPNVEGLPLHAELSAVSPDHPVALTHASGHALYFNEAAMNKAGITDKTADPDGGEIVRDKSGHATGVFRELAADLVRPDASELDYSDATQRRRAKLARENCLQNGITSFHDAGSEFREIELLKKLATEDALGVRLWVMLAETIGNEELKKTLKDAKFVDDKNHRITIGGIKRYIDGALGSHGAWLLQPYKDKKSSTGLSLISDEDLTETAKLAKEYGFQLCVHAIGDKGNRKVLDVYEKVLGKDAKKGDYRWRIEHAQHLNPAEVPRFASLGVVASMQGVHARSDGPWVPDRIGDKRAQEGAYVWRELIDAGAVVVNGTDAPVEDISPLASYHTSVTRELADGTTFYPEHKMSRLEALKTYTINAAFSVHEEKLKGSLTPGKLADVTVLSHDILTVAAEKIRSTEVMMTIVGGKVLYDSASTPK